MVLMHSNHGRMPFTSTLGIESNHLLLKSVTSCMFIARIPPKENSTQPSVKVFNVRHSRNSVLDLVGLHEENHHYAFASANEPKPPGHYSRECLNSSLV